MKDNQGEGVDQGVAMCEVCEDRTAVTTRGPMLLRLCDECADGWDDLQYVDDWSGKPSEAFEANEVVA